MGLSPDIFRDGEVLMSVIQFYLLFGFFLNFLLIPHAPIMEKKTQVSFPCSLWYYFDSSVVLATLFLFFFPTIFLAAFSVFDFPHGGGLCLSPWVFSSLMSWISYSHPSFLTNLPCVSGVSLLAPTSLTLTELCVCIRLAEICQCLSSAFSGLEQLPSSITCVEPGRLSSLVPSWPFLVSSIPAIWYRLSGPWFWSYSCYIMLSLDPFWQYLQQTKCNGG